jgi:hypothetical protein
MLRIYVSPHGAPHALQRGISLVVLSRTVAANSVGSARVAGKSTAATRTHRRSIADASIPIQLANGTT